MTTRADDLTILLRARDLTKGPMASLAKRLKGIGPIAKFAMGAASTAAGVLTVAIGAATLAGRELALELDTAAKSLNISFQETQVLFDNVREFNGAIRLENLTEGMITYKELVADAEIGTGALFGLIEDKNLKINLDLDDPRAQLANFLTEVNKLETANDRIFALKELGDEFAELFLPVINDMEKTDALAKRLIESFKDFPGLITKEQLKDIQDYRESTSELNRAWDNFALTVFADLAPALETLNDKLVKVLGVMQSMWNWAVDLTNVFKDTLAPALKKYLETTDAIPDELKEGFLNLPFATFNNAKQGFSIIMDLVKDKFKGTIDDLNDYVNANPVGISVPLAFATGDPLFNNPITPQDMSDETSGRIKDEPSADDQSSRPRGSGADRLAAAREAELAAAEAHALMVADALQSPYEWAGDFVAQASEDIAEAAFAGLMSPYEQAGSVLNDFATDYTERQKSLASVTREAWFEIGATINQGLDAAMRPVGQYIEVTEQMSEAERNAAEQSNAINRKRFEQNKQFALAQAAVSAALGIARAFEAGPILGPILAAQTAIATYAQIEAIRASEFGSAQTAGVPNGGAANTSPIVPDVGDGTAAAGVSNRNRKVDVTVDFDGLGDDDILTGALAKNLIERAIEEGIVQAA